MSEPKRRRRKIDLRATLGLGAVLFVILVVERPSETACAATSLACTVSFKMEELVAVGRVRFTATYPAGVELVGSGAAPSCRSLVRDDEPVTATFFDDDTGVLSVDLSSVRGFPGLNGLAICDLLADVPPLPKDFTTTVIEIVDPAGDPIQPMPAVSLLEVFCPPTTTTTLLPPLCGDANDDGEVRATDALIALQAAVGSMSCPLAACDVDSSGEVTPSDALLILRVAVGSSGSLVCPA